MDRRPYNEWIEEKDGARGWAREKAKHILGTHEPEPLDISLMADLEKIIKSVEKESRSLKT
jgi:trimethylamine:corrinoid methyltransferase-like protein